MRMAVTLPPQDDRTLAPPGSGGRDTVVHDSGGTIPRSAPLPIGEYLRHFEITGHLGEGGFGIVYVAQDHRLQRMVAIKEYMPSSLAWRLGDNMIVPISEKNRPTFEAGLNSFRQEARLLAHFDHPGLVKVYEYWDANGTAYMVTPFYEGPTLKVYLNALAEPPDEAWLKSLLHLLIGALEAMHGKQCMHRDISPDNILIRVNGAPVLLDFGAARQVINNMVQTLTVILKPGYAPVEQYAQGSANEQGPWTDVYALAAVVYFAITGKAPLPSVARVMTDTLPPLSQVAAGRYSAAFLAGLDKALSVRPEDRPQSMRELAAMLDLEDSKHNVGVPPVLVARSTPAASRAETWLAEPFHTPSQRSAGDVVPAVRSGRLGPLLIGGMILSVVAVLFVIVTRQMQDDGNVPTPTVLSPASDARPAQSNSTPASSRDNTDAVASRPTAGDAAGAPNNEPGAGGSTAKPGSAMTSVPVGESSMPGVRQDDKHIASTPVRPASNAQAGGARPMTDARSKAPANARSAHCSDVLSRLQIGEAISSEEQARFQKECQR